MMFGNAEAYDRFMGRWSGDVRTVETDRLAMLRNAVKRRLSLSSESDAFALHARVWAVRGTVPGEGA
jgi:hypothetical protein